MIIRHIFHQTNGEEFMHIRLEREDHEINRKIHINAITGYHKSSEYQYEYKAIEILNRGWLYVGKHLPDDHWLAEDVEHTPSRILLPDKLILQWAERHNVDRASPELRTMVEDARTLTIKSKFDKNNE